MAGEVTKSEGALARAAELVDEARRDLDQGCTELRNKLGEVPTLWAGGGAAAFVQVYGQWQKETDKVIRELQTFESNLRRSEATYARADESARSGMTKAESRLGPGRAR